MASAQFAEMVELEARGVSVIGYVALVDPKEDGGLPHPVDGTAVGTLLDAHEARPGHHRAHPGVPGPPPDVHPVQAARAVRGVAADPVEIGLVASLAHPGGNITGMSMMTSELGGKRLELLKRTVPGLARVAVLWNPPNLAYGPILRELEAAAPTLGVKLLRLEVQVPADFEAAFKAATTQRAGALILPGDPLISNRLRMVADLALKYRLPTIMDLKEFVEAGGLLSLGLDLVDSYRRAATHVDKILKGANPAEPCASADEISDRHSGRFPHGAPDPTGSIIPSFMSQLP